MFTRNRVVLMVGALFACCFSTTTFAATVTGEDNAAGDSSAVSMTISDTCDFTVSDVTFGTLGLITSANTSDGTLSVVCTQGTQFDITFEAAQTLTNGSTLVPYSVALLNPPTLTGTGVQQVLDIRATLNPTIAPPAGVYTDATVVTLTIDNI